MDIKRSYSIFSQLTLVLCFSSKAYALQLFPHNKLENLKTGQMIDLAFYRGLPTFVSFFQPGCASCKKQVKEFICLDKKHPQKFNVLYFGTYAKKAALIKTIEKEKLPYPAYLATNSYLKSVGGIKYTPLTLLSNHQGKLVKRISGSISCQKMERLLKQKKLL